MQIEVRSPFPIESLPRTWPWMEPFRAKVSDDFSPQNLPDFLTAMVAKWDSIRTWSVYGDGELGGLITFEKLTPWVGTAHLLLKAEFHRRGIAVQAAKIAVTEMFKQESIGKLACYPLAGNLAIGSLLCNLGGKREGTLAGHTLCDGKPTDMWLYGLLKTDFLAAMEHRREQDQKHAEACAEWEKQKTCHQ